MLHYLPLHILNSNMIQYIPFLHMTRRVLQYLYRASEILEITYSLYGLIPVKKFHNFTGAMDNAQLLILSNNSERNKYAEDEKQSFHSKQSRTTTTDITAILSTAHATILFSVLTPLHVFFVAFINAVSNEPWLTKMSAVFDHLAVVVSFCTNCLLRAIN